MSKVLDGIVTDLKCLPQKLSSKTKDVDIRKAILMNMPYISIGYVADLVSRIYRTAPGEDASQKAMVLMKEVGNLFARPFPSLHPIDIGVGIACGVALKVVVMQKAKNAKKFRPGVEYGSARWGTKKDIEPFMDPVFEKNIPLTQTEGLMMSSRPSSPKYARNKNILVIGGSGSGKTRFFVKPSLMQLHSSYVVTDPKGTLIIECGKMFVKHGYKVKVLNTINFDKSMKYNPFAYIHSEKDILKLVNTIMVNTKGEGAQATEDFWTKAERLLFTAYIGYIWYEAIEEEKNFVSLLDMIDASETKEDDENYQNAVDLMFEELEKKKPDHFAVRQYKKYKLAAGVITYKRLLMMFIG